MTVFRHFKRRRHSAQIPYIGCIANHTGSTRFFLNITFTVQPVQFWIGLYGDVVTKVRDPFAAYYMSRGRRQAAFHRPTLSMVSSVCEGRALQLMIRADRHGSLLCLDDTRRRSTHDCLNTSSSGSCLKYVLQCRESAKC